MELLKRALLACLNIPYAWHAQTLPSDSDGSWIAAPPRVSPLVDLVVRVAFATEMRYLLCHGLLCQQRIRLVEVLQEMHLGIQVTLEYLLQVLRKCHRLGCVRVFCLLSLPNGGGGSGIL